MNLKAFFIASCLPVFAACATTPPISLTMQEQHVLGGVTGTLFIPQNSLIVTVEPTNPGPTGLLGVLMAAGIDAARRSTAEKEASSILEQLHDYDFRTVMKQASNEAATKIHKIKFNAPLGVEKIGSASQKRIVFDNSSSSAVLFVDVGYQLQSGNLNIAANATMYPKSGDLLQFRKKPDEIDPLATGNAIYRKTFYFTRFNVTAADIKVNLTDGADSIASQLFADLKHPL